MFEETSYNSQPNNESTTTTSPLQNGIVRKPRKSKYNLLTQEERTTLSKKEYSRLYSQRYFKMMREITKETGTDSPKEKPSSLETTVETSEPPAEPKKRGGRPRTVYPEDDGQGEISPERRSKLSTAEARREYQRQYYQMHKEKAKEYQRQYNLTHKKKARGGRGKSSFNASREVVRSTFNTGDLMHSPVEKTIKMLEKILKGERLFTM